MSWFRRRYWAWQLRHVTLPYPVPQNEPEEGMNMITVMAAMGNPPTSGRDGW